MKSRSLAIAVSICAALIAVSPALAHTGIAASDAASGLLHPLTGLDHLLAMVAVGLWAGQQGGRARWAIPCTFLVMMAAAGAAGVANASIPGVELGILGSVVLLGALVASAPRLPLWLCAAVAGLFAVVHGYAHGAVVPAGEAGLAFGFGVVAMTALLLGLGLGLALAGLTRLRLGAARAAGAAIIVLGLAPSVVG